MEEKITNKDIIKAVEVLKNGKKKPFESLKILKKYKIKGLIWTGNGWIHKKTLDRL